MGLYIDSRAISNLVEIKNCQCYRLSTKVLLKNKKILMCFDFIPFDEFSKDQEFETERKCDIICFIR